MKEGMPGQITDATQYLEKFGLKELTINEEDTIPFSDITSVFKQANLFLNGQNENFYKEIQEIYFSLGYSKLVKTISHDSVEKYNLWQLLVWMFYKDPTNNILSDLLSSHSQYLTKEDILQKSPFEGVTILWQLTIALDLGAISQHSFEKIWRKHAQAFTWDKLMTHEGKHPIFAHLTSALAKQRFSSAYYYAAWEKCHSHLTSTNWTNLDSNSPYSNLVPDLLQALMQGNLDIRIWNTIKTLLNTRILEHKPDLREANLLWKITNALANGKLIAQDFKEIWGEIKNNLKAESLLRVDKSCSAWSEVTRALANGNVLEETFYDIGSAFSEYFTIDYFRASPPLASPFWYICKALLNGYLTKDTFYIIWGKFFKELTIEDLRSIHQTDGRTVFRLLIAAIESNRIESDILIKLFHIWNDQFDTKDFTFFPIHPRFTAPDGLEVLPTPAVPSGPSNLSLLASLMDSGKLAVKEIWPTLWKHCEKELNSTNCCSSIALYHSTLWYLTKILASGEFPNKYLPNLESIYTSIIHKVSWIAFNKRDYSSSLLSLLITCLLNHYLSPKIFKLIWQKFSSEITLKDLREVHPTYHASLWYLLTYASIVGLFDQSEYLFFFEKHKKSLSAHDFTIQASTTNDKSKIISDSWLIVLIDIEKCSNFSSILKPSFFPSVSYSLKKHLKQLFADYQRLPRYQSSFSENFYKRIWNNIAPLIITQCADSHHNSSFKIFLWLASYALISENLSAENFEKLFTSLRTKLFTIDLFYTLEEKFPSLIWLLMYASLQNKISNEHATKLLQEISRAVQWTHWEWHPVESLTRNISLLWMFAYHVPYLSNHSATLSTEISSPLHTVVEKFISHFNAALLCRAPQEGLHAGKSLWWLLTYHVFEKIHTNANLQTSISLEILRKVWNNHRQTLLIEDLRQAPCDQNSEQNGVTLLWLFAAIAPVAPEFLIEVLQRFGNSLTAEDFNVTGETSGFKNISVLKNMVKTALKDNVHNSNLKLAINSALVHCNKSKLNTNFLKKRKGKESLEEKLSSSKDEWSSTLGKILSPASWFADILSNYTVPATDDCQLHPSAELSSKLEEAIKLGYYEAYAVLGHFYQGNGLFHLARKVFELIPQQDQNNFCHKKVLLEQSYRGELQSKFQEQIIVHTSLPASLKRQATKSLSEIRTYLKSGKVKTLPFLSLLVETNKIFKVGYEQAHQDLAEFIDQSQQTSDALAYYKEDDSYEGALNIIKLLNACEKECENELKEFEIIENSLPAAPALLHLHNAKRSYSLGSAPRFVSSSLVGPSSKKSYGKK